MEDSTATHTHPANVDEYRQWWSEQRPVIPYGSCWCGCGQRTNLSPTTVVKKLNFRHEPYRYVLGHANTWTASRKDYEVRDCGHETPCWVWKRYIHPETGYGAVMQRKGGTKKLIRAHRLYYEFYKGVIPNDKQLDHLCRIRPCVNPDHLEPVDNQTNTQRGNSTKLTPKEVLAIRAAKEERGVDLAAKYGVLPSTICQIRQRRSWRNLP